MKCIKNGIVLYQLEELKFNNKRNGIISIREMALYQQVEYKCIKNGIALYHEMSEILLQVEWKCIITRNGNGSASGIILYQ